jgi:regulation of enolase protein 1 (concanavalin A-like superfamily)
LAAEISCTVAVTFIPTALGTRSGTLVFTDDASTSPQSVTLTGNGSTVEINSIVVSPPNPSIDVGSTQQFTATGNRTSGEALDLTNMVAWTSSSSGVAAIDAGGLATGIAAGTATITATLGTISGATDLTVTNPNPGLTLSASRYMHSATLLNNGKILIAGGINCSSAGSCTYLNSAELYDPGTGTFSNSGSMSQARTAPAVLLANGKVLIAGGYFCDSSNNCSSLKSAEIYDPVSGTFSSAGDMTTDREGHTITLLNNGQVLIAGGETCTSTSSCTPLNSAEIFKPVSGTFTATAGPLNYARFGAAATLLGNGQVLVVGGYDGSNYLAQGDIYDPAEDYFLTTWGTLNTPRYAPTATLLNNGQVLIAGGSNCTLSGCLIDSAELYYPAADSFYITAAGMNHPRFRHTATLLNNGQVFIAGGYSACSSSSSCTSEASTEICDPIAGVFNLSQVLAPARAGHSATLLSDGMVLLAGGIDGGKTLGENETYLPDGLTPAGLVSIVISPANPIMTIGESQALTAVGTFSDNSTQTLAAVTWRSLDSSVATVTGDATNSGMAFAAKTGSTVLNACVGSVCGSTALTVGPALSNGWSDLDIGPVRLTGSATVVNGAVTIIGAGQTVGSTDALHFVYRPLSGDGSITARVVNVYGSSYADVGVMIRETLDPGAANSYLFVGSSPYQPYVYVRGRASTGGISSSGTYAPAPWPCWLRLVRNGNLLSAYTSPDGVNWAQFGSNQTIMMAQNVYVGLAVDNSGGSTLATATFDNVSIDTPSLPAPFITALSATTGPAGSQVAISGLGFGATQGESIVTLNAVPVTINSWSDTVIIVTIPAGATSGFMVVSVAPGMNASNHLVFTVTSQALPSPWLDQDVGPMAMPGSATYSAGTFTASASSTAPGSTYDGVHFVYRHLSGNGAIVARVAGLQGGGGSQAGVMVRETLSVDSKIAFVFYQDGSMNLLDRAGVGGSTYTQCNPPRNSCVFSMRNQ